MQELTTYELFIKFGKSIEDILKDDKNINKECLISLLSQSKCEEVKQAFYEYYKKNKIDTNRLLLIADTHLGSLEEDIKLIYATYNYAAKNNITNIIHAGDLIQGETFKYYKSNSYEEQLFKILDIYIKLSKFNTYYILGNHEMNLNKEELLLLRKTLSYLNNLKEIGYENTYIYLKDNNPIRVTHDIPKNNNLITPLLNTIIAFEGHHHFYSERDNVVFIPPLATNCNNIYIDSGFIDLTITDDAYISNCKAFNKDYSIRDRYEYIIKKP